VNVRFSTRFERSYAKAPAQIQRLFDQKLDLLLQNLRHPSLRTKKYDEARDIWQGRVTKGWRFYFTIKGDTYEIADLTPHPK
jgi:mRNA-degrading endonuclease RelE of RelBE toxin-antitoxin system